MRKRMNMPGSFLLSFTMFFFISTHVQAEVTIHPASGVLQDKDAVIISEAGIYTISGKETDRQVVIKTDKEETVSLILDQVDLTCTDKAAILAASGNLKLILRGDNYLEGGGEQEEAAVYVKDDLYISGNGSLAVHGTYKHGIECRDALYIENGSITVNALKDGIRGRELLEIYGGYITCKTENDGLKSNSDDVENPGKIHIFDGTMEIDVADDGIHAEDSIEIWNGTIDITNCNEGIEAHHINIDGGEIKVQAIDDGINANGEEGLASLTISGGNIEMYVQGDGLDSNGSLELTGGHLLIHGTTSPHNSPLDYNGRCTAENTILVASGSAGMAAAPFSKEPCSTLRIYFSQMQSKNSEIRILSEDDREIIRFKPEKDYQALIFIDPALVAGKKVRIYQKMDEEAMLCECILKEGLTSIDQSGLECDYMSNRYGW